MRRHPAVEVYPKGFVPPHLAKLRMKGRESEAPGEQINQEANRVNDSFEQKI